jgi:hypothetical protein
VTWAQFRASKLPGIKALALDARCDFLCDLVLFCLFFVGILFFG